MFHIGRPVVQFLIILMIVSVMMMTSKYYQVRTFEQVVACGQPANIFSMNVVVGHEETMTIKDQKSIHQIITALEETTFLPSFKESSSLTRGPIMGGREITLEFLGMDEVDSVTICSRGVLYNNVTGQAYGFDDDYLYHRIESIVLGESSS